MTVSKGKRERSPIPRRHRSAEDVRRAVWPVAERITARSGLLLWDVRFTRDAGRDTLRIACDRPGGVTADELASVAEALSRDLDAIDAVPGDANYVLEVTSPGAEREVEGPAQFTVCVGRHARLTLADGRVLEGEIRSVSERAVELGTDPDQTSRVFFEDIARAQLVLKGIG